MEKTMIAEAIKKMIITRLKLPIEAKSIKDDATLFNDDDGGLGLDSVDSLDLAVGIRNEFNIEVTEDDLSIFKSIQTIVDFIETKQAVST